LIIELKPMSLPPMPMVTRRVVDESALSWGELVPSFVPARP
jgi:hypothetical protein